MKTLVDCGCIARVHSDGSGVEIDYCDEHAAAPDLLKACKRADRLIGLLTVRQVIKAGDEAIEASGLNPWCMNEGLADGSETISASFLGAAIATAEGK